TKRFEDTTNRPATAVVAQLVASSYRKQTDNTLGLHNDGYTFSPHWFVSPMIGPHVTEYYAGWHLSRLTQVTDWPSIHKGTGQWLGQAGGVRPADIDVLRLAADCFPQPDSRGIPRGGVVPKAPRPWPPLPRGATADARKKALQAFDAATGNYRRYNVDPGGT